MGTLKELLATPDTLRITTPVLPRETLERVLDMLRRDVASGEVRVENPTQNLESYFLEVVRKARQAAAETSGATSGAHVADYLRGEAEAKPETDRVLERLTASEASTQPAVARAEPAAPAPNESALDQLTRPGPQETPSPSTPQPASAEPPPADLSKADEKLSSLLGKPEQ
jgi:hypothetical protein